MWLGGVMVKALTCNREVASSTAGYKPLSGNNLRLSISWYQSRGSDVLRLVR